MHSGKQVAVHDVIGIGFHNGLLVSIGCARLFGRNEGRTNVGKVGAHRLRCQHGGTAGDGTTQCQRAVKPLPDFLDQRERAFQAGMPPRPGSNGDQSIRSLLDRFVGVLVVDNVV